MSFYCSEPYLMFSDIDYTFLARFTLVPGSTWCIRTKPPFLISQEFVPPPASSCSSGLSVLLSCTQPSLPSPLTWTCDARLKSHLLQFASAIRFQLRSLLLGRHLGHESSTKL